MARRPFQNGLCAALAATLLYAGSTAAAVGNEIRIGLAEGAATMDPANFRHRVTGSILRNIHDGLLTRDGRMRLANELVEDWVQTGPLSFEMTLKRDVRFHDGTVMTVEDVIFTFERLTVKGAMNGRTSPRADLLPRFKSITSPAPDIVRFDLVEPWPYLPSVLPMQMIISKAFTMAAGPEGLERRANGAGPFRLSEWRKDGTVTLERFDGYHGGAQQIPPVGPACLERATFKVIPSAEARIKALQDGKIDLIDKVPSWAVESLIFSKNVDALVSEGTRSTFITLNVDRPPFNDRRVRAAVNHAIDRAWIIEGVLGNHATVING
ncbi:MAG: ABC transporter substrate-binding protein, partial [Rhodospirillales bacterium]|nr:ABC transporter substrate-binding protein [Rhodospirillales bacterium]